MSGRMQTFQDLDTWKAAHALLLLVYRVTDTFPDKERFGLISQIRRAALSVTSNIAEGFGRLTQGDKVRFYSIAAGSLTEVQNQLLASRDLSFLGQERFFEAWEQSENAKRLLSGLVRSARNRP